MSEHPMTPTCVLIEHIGGCTILISVKRRSSFVCFVLQVVSNLILMIGVNVAGIFVYDRRDQVHRKLFEVIRACTSAGLRIQSERSKLVLPLACIYPLSSSFCRVFLARGGTTRAVIPIFISRWNCVIWQGVLSIDRECSNWSFKIQ